MLNDKQNELEQLVNQFSNLEMKDDTPEAEALYCRQAYEIAEKILAIDPEHPKAAMIKLGQLHDDNKHSAVIEMGNRLAKNPNFHQRVNDHAMIYCFLAMSYFESRQPDLSLIACEKMQAIRPDFGQAWFYPGYVHHELAKRTADHHDRREHLEKAIELYTKADQIDKTKESDNSSYLDHCKAMLAKLDASASYCK